MAGAVIHLLKEGLSCDEDVDLPNCHPPYGLRLTPLSQVKAFVFKTKMAKFITTKGTHYSEGKKLECPVHSPVQVLYHPVAIRGTGLVQFSPVIDDSPGQLNLNIAANQSISVRIVKK